MYGIDTSEEETAVTVDEFVAWAADMQRPPGYRATITHIEIIADVAMAILVEEKYYNTPSRLSRRLVATGFG